MSMMKEFKEFAVKGNVMDMAVGVIIGAAFGKIVTSLVNDIIMPPIGLLLGRMDFSNLAITLHEKVGDAPAVTLNYGLFINTVINFIIVAFAVFMLVKQVNRFKKAAEATTKECPRCISKVDIHATRCPHCTSEL